MDIWWIDELVQLGNSQSWKTMETWPSKTQGQSCIVLQLSNTSSQKILLIHMGHEPGIKYFSSYNYTCFEIAA